MNRYEAVRSAHGTATRRRRASFTLVELLVVVTIIILAVSIVGPAISAMWEQRLQSQAEIVLTGAIRSVQMQARTKGERGLFFYVDDDGVQQIAIIEPVREWVDDDGDPLNTVQVLVDCFKLADGATFRMPPPYRVVPRTAALAYGPTRDPRANWEATELNAENVAEQNAPPTNERHRNFFTLLFGPDGRLRVGRTVLIAEITDDDPEEGDRTDLPVGNATQFYDNSAVPQSFPGTPSPTVGRMVVEFDSGGTAPSENAINFPSVDGVVIYDDVIYRDTPAANDADDTSRDRRDYLARSGIPFILSPISGDVIRGRRGE